MNSRIRKSAGLVAALGLLGSGAVAFATGASATEARVTCPTLGHDQYLQFAPGSTSQIANGGLGVWYANDAGTEPLENAALTVQVIENLTFQKPAKPMGGQVKSEDSAKVVVGTDVLAKHGKLGVRIPASVGSADKDVSVKVTFTADGVTCGEAEVTTAVTPSEKPSEKPTEKPTSAPSPSEEPTVKPTDKPSPSEEPTEKPTASPSEKPTDMPEPTPSESEPEEENSPTPATGGADGEDGGGSDLAQTGSSSSTPMLIGAAGALVVVGGGLAVFAKRRKANAAA